MIEICTVHSTTPEVSSKREVEEEGDLLVEPEMTKYKIRIKPLLLPELLEEL